MNTHSTTRRSGKASPRNNSKNSSAAFRVKVSALGALVTVFSFGCSAQQTLSRWASPEIHCPQEEISITLEHSTKHSASYLATCSDGSSHECFSQSDGLFDQVTTCHVIEESNETYRANLKPAITSTESWVEVELEGCATSASFPGHPRELTIPMPEGVSSSRTVMSEIDDRAFVVSCTQYALPEGATEFQLDSERLLRASAEGMAKSTGGELAGFRYQQEKDIANVLVKVPNEGTLLGRLLVRDGLLVSSLAGPRERISNEDLTKFFGGVRVGE